MKNILLIGVGGTGSNAVEILYKKIHELGSQTKNKISAIVFDTDEGSVETIKDAVPVSMADPASVGTICDRIGKEYLREWFPCDDKAIRNQEMVRGAAQWRKKSYLAFLNLMNKPQARASFTKALEEMAKDPGVSCEVYVIASIAGGTGSGSFIPIALYARRYLRKQLGVDPIINAMIALPDIYADSQTPDNRTKIYANAYAILREINAINLVARNYNEGNRTARKKSPINFRIGHPNEPNVGVLFDSSDKQFWTPEAAPFNQIFVLDRIPGLHSIQAHDIVLANSLYTLICTDIGVKFDSEASNHEILRSQNNGSNAIFAGISTSQMRFPVDSVLNYLAHDKALKSCDDEWLSLYRATEKKIADNEQQEREMGRKYIPKNGEYAKIVLDELANDEENNKGKITALVDRGTADINEEGKKTDKNTAVIYFDRLKKYINSKVTTLKTEDLVIKVESEVKPTKEVVTNSAGDFKNLILDYYKECINVIKKVNASLSEAILTFDPNKDVFEKNAVSLVNNVLKCGDKFIHPVAAWVQLCRVKQEIVKDPVIGKGKFTEWEDLKRRDVFEINPALLAIDEPSVQIPGVKAEKSGYAKLGADRFEKFVNGTGDYEDCGRTNVAMDIKVIESDAVTVVNKIHNEAVKQLRFKVLKKLSDDVDLLIEKYKNFFNRFEKEKEDLIEETKNAKRLDCGLVDSVLNIYSSEEDKDRILKEVFKSAGLESEQELMETDNLVGGGVFNCIYGAASAAVNETRWNDKDSKAYRSIFSGMIESYRKHIRKSDAFGKIAEFNIVQAMEAASKNSDVSNEAIFRQYFTTVQELATPSLKIDKREDLGDLVQPSSVVVYMLSAETAKYIKKHADELNLHLPADQSNENAVIASCTEEFIRRYSGNDAARVAIVKNMSDTVLYCTGEVMDITPLRIPKFNELSEDGDNLYYKSYRTAIRNFKHYKTDMWNPHIGNNLYKRGYLPYMNEKKEVIEDNKMVKALLYGLNSEKIIYVRGMSKSRDIFAFKYFNKDGNKDFIKGNDCNLVTKENIAQLISWLRNEDDLIEEWSEEFDKDIAKQKNELPNVVNESDIAKLEGALTRSNFMSIFHDELFCTKEGATKSNKCTVLEFAYLIKASEESLRDCDDAERILDVVYAVFKEMCSFRVNMSTNAEAFANVYRQQLGKVFESLAKSRTVSLADFDCESYFKQLVNWLQCSNTFLCMSDSQPIDAKGNVVINEKFDDDNYPEVRAALAETKAKAKAKKSAKAEN